MPPPKFPKPHPHHRRRRRHFGRGLGGSVVVVEPVYAGDTTYAWADRDWYAFALGSAAAPQWLTTPERLTESEATLRLRDLREQHGAGVLAFIARDGAWVQVRR